MTAHSLFLHNLHQMIVRNSCFGTYVCKVIVNCSWMCILFYQKKSIINHYFSIWLPITFFIPIYIWTLISSSLSNGLGSNMQKTSFKKFLTVPMHSLMSEFWHGVFCKLLSKPFDKIKMTRGQGQWPRDLGKLGWFSCALLL